MRSITPWISTYVDSCVSEAKYDHLPAWLRHPYHCFNGILNGSVSDENDLRNLLFVLCAGAKVAPAMNPRYTLQMLLVAWEKRFPGYEGGFGVQAGRRMIWTGCCYDLNDVSKDLRRIEEIPEKPDYHEYGSNAWSQIWLGHDPDVTVIYKDGYLNIYDYDVRHVGRERGGVMLSFTPLEWHARSWSCLRDLHDFTYGPFREYLRKLCPECADRLVKLWSENMGIASLPDRWY